MKKDKFWDDRNFFFFFFFFFFLKYNIAWLQRIATKLISIYDLLLMVMSFRIKIPGMDNQTRQEIAKQTKKKKQKIQKSPFVISAEKAMILLRS